MKSKQTKITQRILSLSLGLSLMGLTACGNNPSTVSVQIGSLVASHPILDFFVPNAYAAASNVQMCVKRLRFKKADDSDDGISSDELAASDDDGSDSDNIDFSPGLITLTQGQEIGVFPLEQGTYTRIEIDVEQNCASGVTASSVSWENSGSYSSNETITIKFEGTFEASGGSQTLQLGVASIMSAIEGVTNNSQIKDALEAAGGEMED